MTAYCEVEFPTAQAPARPIALRSVLQMYGHDLLELRYLGVDASAAAFATGVPVRVRYGRSTAFREFVGYVNDRSYDTYDGQPEVRVRCLGPSVLLDERVGTPGPLGVGVPTVAQRQTGVRMACAVAGEHGFDVVRDAVGEEPLTVASARSTKFRTLVGRARERGKAFYVSNTTLWFYDPVEHALANQSTAVTVDVDVLDGVQSFSAVSGEDRLGYPDASEHAVYEIRDVDLASQQVYAVRSAVTARLGRSGPARVVRAPAARATQGAADARTRADGAALDGRWVSRARLVTYGDVRVQQGTGLVVRGVQPADEGLWVVTCVEHRLDRATGGDHEHWMTVDLARDGVRRAAAPAQVLPTASVRMLDTPGQRQGVRSSRSVLRGGLWQSDLQREVVLG